jgi:hypothetical protein
MKQEYGLIVPKEVLLAIKLMIVGAVLGVVQMALTLPSLVNLRSSWIAVLAILIFSCISGFLIYRVSRGGGIARVAYAVLLIFSLTRWAKDFGGFFESFPLAASLSLVQAAVQLYAVYLLFGRPSAEWFARVAQEEAKCCVLQAA